MDTNEYNWVLPAAERIASDRMNSPDHNTVDPFSPSSRKEDWSPGRRRSLRWTIPLLIAFGLIFLVRLPTMLAPAGQDSPGVEKPAPQLDLVALNDQPQLQRLQEFPEGSVTLLHFWGTWCGPCRMEFPELASMAKQKADSPRFLFLPVSCEAHHSESLEGLCSKTERYCESEGIVVTAYADPRGWTRRSVAKRLEVAAIVYPTSVLIDADGHIAGVWEGYTPASVHQIELLINRLLQRAADRKASS